jgi:hypothetical protein
MQVAQFAELEAIGKLPVLNPPDGWMTAQPFQQWVTAFVMWLDVYQA